MLEEWALVSGLYEEGMLAQAASRVKLSLMDGCARGLAGFAVCLSLSLSRALRGDDIRKTHRGGAP